MVERLGGTCHLLVSGSPVYDGPEHENEGYEGKSMWRFGYGEQEVDDVAASRW